MRGVPRSVKDDDPVSSVKVDAESAGLCRYQKQSQPAKQRQEYVSVQIIYNDTGNNILHKSEKKGSRK